MRKSIFEKIADMAERGPKAVNDYLRHLLGKGGVFSTKREGNFSVTYRGRDFNYRVDGQELFFKRENDALRFTTAMRLSIQKTPGIHYFYLDLRLRYRKN